MAAGALNNVDEIEMEKNDTLDFGEIDLLNIIMNMSQKRTNQFLMRLSLMRIKFSGHLKPSFCCKITLGEEPWSADASAIVVTNQLSPVRTQCQAKRFALDFTSVSVRRTGAQ